MASVTTKPLKAVCKPCEKGQHRSSHPRCGLDLCSCWCLLGESVVFRPWRRLPEWRHLDLTEILATLRGFGLESRTKADLTAVWRPMPSELPEAIAALLRTNGDLLSLALLPSDFGDLRPRHWWSHGNASVCFGCGKLTITRDPLGQIRHLHCGWLRQLAH